MIRTLDAFRLPTHWRPEATEMVSAALRMRDCEILFGVRIMPE